MKKLYALIVAFILLVSPSSTGTSLGAANGNWNPETGGILLAQAHSPSTVEHTQAHDLYDILNARPIGNQNFTLDGNSTLNEKYQRWFNRKQGEFRRSVDSPENSQMLSDYKDEAIEWLDGIIAEANAREYAALYVSDKTNESNKAVTKEDLFNIIRNETESRFVPLPGANTLEEYAAHAENTSVILGCDDLDNLEQARLNYALYTLFDDASDANANDSKSRDDLYYEVLPESINSVTAFYEDEDGSGKDGVTQMASVIEGAFQDPPIAANDTLKDTDACNSFNIDDITLTNSQRSEAILRGIFIKSDGGFFGLNSITRNLNQGDFSLDAYCALSIVNSDFLISDTLYSGRGVAGSDNIGLGRRLNFNNDNSIDDVDETGVPFLMNVVNMDRLTEVTRSAYEVALATNKTAVVNRHRYSEKFNGADMDVFLQIIEDEYSFQDLLVVIRRITELILTDDTLDSDSKQQLRDRVIANPPFLSSDYYLDPTGDYERLDAIINIVSDDVNVRISDKVISDVNVRASQISNFYFDDRILDADTISHLIKTARSDSSFGLDRLDPASRDNRLVEIMLIIIKISSDHMDLDNDNIDSDSRAIINDILLNSPELTLTYYSNSNTINKLVDIVRNEFLIKGLYSDEYLDTLDSESIIELINRVGLPNLNYNLNRPLHNIPFAGGLFCFGYPDDHYIGSVSSHNLLTFYLNLFYDPDVDDHRLFSRLYEDELAHPDTVALFHKEYYSLVYEALTYAAVLNVSNSPDPTEQALEIEKGVTRAANIFLFNTIVAPYNEVKTEYTQCYDVGELFSQDTFANCMASFVKTHFENLEYQSLIDSGLDNSEDITSFFTNTAGFYLTLLENIRLSVAASMQEIKEKVDQVFPTPMNVCQAAEDAANDLAILSDSTHPDYVRAEFDVSAVLDSAGVADKDDILSVLESNPARKDAVDELFIAFDSEFSPSIFSDDGLDCDRLPDRITILNVIQYISNAAGAIITPAKEEREAAEAVKRFLEGWGGQSQQLDIAFDVVPFYIDGGRTSHLTLTSSTFHVKVIASNYRNLAKLNVTIKSLENPVVGQQITKMHTSDDVISWDCIDQGELENCEVVVEIDASSLV